MKIRAKYYCTISCSTSTTLMNLTVKYYSLSITSTALKCSFKFILAHLVRNLKSRLNRKNTNKTKQRKYVLKAKLKPRRHVRSYRWISPSVITKYVRTRRTKTVMHGNNVFNN